MVEPTFRELLDRKGVFANRDFLSPHYIPEKLLYRDNELKTIMVSVAPALKHQKPRNLVIYGKTGTGKSCTTRKVLQKLEAEGDARVRSVYINCRNYSTRYSILQNAITSFDPHVSKTGYSFSILYEKMLDWVEGSGEGKQVILVLDEVDLVRDLDNLLYTITRANDDLSSGNISFIGISNKINFFDRLDQRSKSSLCEEQLVFQPYDASQLKGILEQRAEQAFHKDVVQESALALAAAIAARENGDARYALTLMLRAGDLAEQRSQHHITDALVEQARKLADEDKALEVISSLPEHQMAVLFAIASIALDSHYKRLVEEAGEKFYFSGEVYEGYCAAVKKMGKDPVSSRWYREYLTELELLGLITTVHSGKGVRGHTTLIRITYDPNKIKRVLEKKLYSD